jgi:hypothetical protein
MFLAVSLCHCFIRCSKHFCTDYLFICISHVNLILLNNFFISQNSLSRTTKLSSRPFSSRATRNSSFQTKRVHCSACSDQTKHFRILVPILKYSVLISSIIARNVSVELRYILCIYITSILVLHLTPNSTTSQTHTTFRLQCTHLYRFTPTLLPRDRRKSSTNTVKWRWMTHLVQAAGNFSAVSRTQ